MAADGFTTTIRDDCLDFLTSHARHRLETLRPTSSRTFRTGALWDASAATYWEVSNGERIAVVEGWRAQVGSSLRYRLRTGHVIMEQMVIEIPDGDIREQIDRALYPGVAPERKLSAFVEAFSALVRDLDPESFDILYDVPGDPTLAAARLPRSAMGRLQGCLRRIFDEADSAKLITNLAGTDDALAGFIVFIRQHIRIEG